MKLYRLTTLITFSLLLCMCFTPRAVAQDDMYDDLQFEDDITQEELEYPVYDPWEGFNRKGFAVNDFLVKYLFNPLSNGYDFLVHKKIQKGLHNFFTNLNAPVRLGSSLLQGDLKKSGIVLTRFTVNTVVGLGGFLDPADQAFDLKLQEEDFGQTLGVWGMDEGRYLFIPVFGPTNTRDLVGYVGNLAMSPLFWLGVTEPDHEDVYKVMIAVKRINKYSFVDRDRYVGVTEDAVDPYTAVQHAYTQIRRQAVNE